MPNHGHNLTSASHKDFCREHGLSERHPPCRLNRPELAEFAQIIQCKEPARRGEHLFRMGDPITALYALRSGSIKVYIITEDGREQVLGFVFPGEVLGFDAIETGHHDCSAVTLEKTCVCEIPYDRLKDLCTTSPDLDEEVHKMFGRKISSDYKTILLLLTRKTAEERLASFVLDLSKRLSESGISGFEYTLSMPRRDIANYLGLAEETVSRTFARFRRQQLAP